MFLILYKNINNASTKHSGQRYPKKLIPIKKEINNNNNNGKRQWGMVLGLV